MGYYINSRRMPVCVCTAPCHVDHAALCRLPDFSGSVLDEDHVFDASRESGNAGPRQFQDLVSVQEPHECIDLALVARDLDHEALRRDIDDAAAENIGDGDDGSGGASGPALTLIIASSRYTLSSAFSSRISRTSTSFATCFLDLVENVVVAGGHDRDARELSGRRSHRR
jgi:hypothetical protein